MQKGQPEGKRGMGSRTGADNLPREGSLIWGFCFIRRVLILWWERDKGTARFPKGAMHAEWVVSPSTPAAGLGRLGPCCPPTEWRGWCCACPKLGYHCVVNTTWGLSKCLYFKLIRYNWSTKVLSSAILAFYRCKNSQEDRKTMQFTLL